MNEIIDGVDDLVVSFRGIETDVLTPKAQHLMQYDLALPSSLQVDLIIQNLCTHRASGLNQRFQIPVQDRVDLTAADIDLLPVYRNLTVNR